MNSLVVLSATPDISWYTNNNDYLSQSSFFISTMRDIGKIIMSGLKWLCDKSQLLFDTTYEMLDFMNYSEVTEFLGNLKIVIPAVLAIAIIALGIIMIVDREKVPKIPTNLILFVAAATLIPSGITKLNEILLTGKDAVVSDLGNISNDIIKNGTVDLLYCDKQNSLADLSVKVDTLSDEQFKSMDATETVNKDTKGISDNAKKYFDYYQIMNPDASVSLKKFDSKGMFDIFDPEWYYRYKFDYFNIYVGLVAVIIALVCSAYKVCRLIYEIVIHRMLAYLYMADITNGQRLGKILISIRDSYIVLFLIAVFVKVFVLANAFIQNMQSWNGFTKTIMLLFCAFALIDGPNLVERLTGIDAGLSSGFGKMVAAYSVAKGAGRAAESIMYGDPLRGRKGILNRGRGSHFKMQEENDTGFQNSIFSGGGDGETGESRNETEMGVTQDESIDAVGTEEGKKESSGVSGNITPKSSDMQTDNGNIKEYFNGNSDGKEAKEAASEIMDYMDRTLKKGVQSISGGIAASESEEEKSRKDEEHGSRKGNGTPEFRREGQDFIYGNEQMQPKAEEKNDSRVAVTAEETSSEVREGGVQKVYQGYTDAGDKGKGKTLTEKKFANKTIDSHFQPSNLKKTVSQESSIELKSRVNDKDKRNLQNKGEGDFK